MISMNDAPYESWVEIRRYSLPAEAEGDALALAAVGIANRLVSRSDGIVLFVGAADAFRARRELVEYQRENTPVRLAAVRLPGDGLSAALGYAAVLVLLQTAATRDLFGLDWWSLGDAQAGRIVSGEWWRAITALMLHVDLGHLASNAFAGAVLGILLAQSVGPGLAWFAILLSGGLGNVLNACFQPPEHAAIGASTAVFAALGLLTSFMWRRRAAERPIGLRRWKPLIAGVTLLAYLGVGGERTDVGGHFAGFAVGAVFGLGLYLAGPRIPKGLAAQWAFGAAALGLLALAWIMALRVG
jgi:membrane associated rhomboid family serine protease